MKLQSLNLNVTNMLCLRVNRTTIECKIISYFLPLIEPQWEGKEPLGSFPRYTSISFIYPRHQD